MDAYNSDSFTSEMSEHKVQLLPVYEKIAIKYDINIDIFIKELINKGYTKD